MDRQDQVEDLAVDLAPVHVLVLEMDRPETGPETGPEAGQGMIVDLEMGVAGPIEIGALVRRARIGRKLLNPADSIEIVCSVDMAETGASLPRQSLSAQNKRQELKGAGQIIGVPTREEMDLEMEGGSSRARDIHKGEVIRGQTIAEGPRKSRLQSLLGLAKKSRDSLKAFLENSGV
jgi:hypothetical protein